MMFYTDGSKIGKVVDAVVAIYDENVPVEEQAYHFPSHATVFQAVLVEIM